MTYVLKTKEMQNPCTGFFFVFFVLMLVLLYESRRRRVVVVSLQKVSANIISLDHFIRLIRQRLSPQLPLTQH